MVPFSSFKCTADATCLCCHWLKQHFCETLDASVCCASLRTTNTTGCASARCRRSGLGAGCKQRLRHACFTGAAPLGKTAGVGAHARRGARAIFVGCDTAPPPPRHSPAEHLQPIRSSWTRRHGKSIYDSTAQLTQRHACCCMSSWEGIWFYRVDARRCVHFKVCASMENDSAK